MSLTYPLAAAALADLLFIADVQFRLEWQQEVTDAGGDMLVADVGPAHWMADITTIPMAHGQAEQVLARLNSLGGGLRTFYLHNPRLPYPQADPDGSSYGASSPVVDTVVDSLNLSLGGFVAGYEITVGDFLSIAYGSPERRYLGQFVESGTADGSGDVSALSVTPPLPAGVESADVVSVIKPAGKFKLVPNSAIPSMRDTAHTTIQFSAKQTHEAG